MIYYKMKSDSIETLVKSIDPNKIKNKKLRNIITSVKLHSHNAKTCTYDDWRGDYNDYDDTYDDSGYDDTHSDWSGDYSDYDD